MTDEELAAYRLSNPKSRATTISDGFTDAGMSYIMEKLYEYRHGITLDATDTIQTQWGLACEMYVFKTIEPHYELMGDMPIRHPQYDFWRGSPDAKNHKLKAVTEIKCPFTRLSFSKLVEPLYRGMDGIEAMRFIRENHSEGESYYWQIVSNGILTGFDTAELIVFMPTRTQLTEIKEMLYHLDEVEQRRFYRIAMMDEDSLPHLHERAEYKPMNKVIFKIPEEDKQLLIERMTDAQIELSKQMNKAYEKSR